MSSADVQVAARLMAVRSATSALHADLAAAMWSDADVQAPSLLSGWSRGHVLTHLARNADGIAHSLAAALRGELLPTYPRGQDARNADIEAGSGRTALTLLTDVKDAADRLDRVFGAVADVDGWYLPANRGAPARDLLDTRWREVEIHRVDLRYGYHPAQWPAEFVAYLLPVELEALHRRTDDALTVEITPEQSVADRGGTRHLVGDGSTLTVAGPDWAVLAWLVGRADPVRSDLSATPELGPWR
jgi:maleylpyruvate isomerase